MNKYIKIINIVVWSILLFNLSAGNFVYGQGQGNAIANMNVNTCSLFPGSAGCAGPSTDKNLSSFSGKVIGVMLQLVASLGIAVLVYGGFRMITAQGSDTGIKKGTSAFTQAFIGVMIVLVSYILISFIQSLLLKSP